MSWLSDRRFEIVGAIEGIRAARRIRRDIAANLATIAEIEARAVRITHGPSGRCFQLVNGYLVTIRNEQPAGSSYAHSQIVQQITTMDAEDFYGWTPA